MKIFYSFKSTVNCLLVVALILAITLRLYRITSNDFIFYDEGMYLSYNRAFLELVSQNFPKDLTQFFIIVKLIFKTALETPKALWFFLMNMRVFITGVEGYYFSRVLSALCGILTIVLTYFWARKYFKSYLTSVLSVIVLSLLPSHVFYSRQGMQESLSCLLFLGGTFLYVFSKRGVSLLTIFSAAFMFAVFLTNYRMIIAPLFIVVWAFFEMLVLKQSFDYKKFLLFMSVYILGFILIGSIENGINLKANLAWMTNQAGESAQYRQWYNFFSFPYYFFKLENIVFGTVLLSSFYYVVKKQYLYLLPFLFVLTQMFIFSFAAEKGARYLCVVLPFASMAVAHLLERLFNYKKNLSIGLIVLMLMGFVFSISFFMSGHAAYERSVKVVKAIDAKAKMISTQPMLERLFVSDPTDVANLPKSTAELHALVKLGYRYLIIDPQLYVSWTKSDQRFDLEELDFISQVLKQARIVQVLPHLNSSLLERFVLDHNQDLKRSLYFLNHSKNKENIYIYDLGV